jgi:hypothetical protein
MRRCGPWRLLLIAVCESVLVSACCAPAKAPVAGQPWRGCRLHFDGAMLPGLQRQADPGPPALAKAPHCEHLSTDGVRDEAESVDDLDALLDRGRVCVSGNRLGAVHACPSLAKAGWKVVSPPAPSGQAASCSNAPPNCPNLVLSIQRPDTDPLRLEFYDDPSGHPSAEQHACQGGETLSPCYYRLARINGDMRF